MDKDLAVRIGDLDVVFFELVPQREHDLPADIGDTFLGVCDPEAKFEVKRAVAEFG